MQTQNLSQLAIGTAQFGLTYGIANKSGKIGETEAAAIIRYAEKIGVNTLDTAMAYGDSEAVLGKIGVRDWNIVSKLSLPEGRASRVEADIRNHIEDSLKRLQVSKLYALLLHRPADLFEPAGDKLYQVLRDMQQEGTISRIGVSIYNPAEMEKILQYFDVNIVQTPLNIFDRRLITGGWLPFLTGKKIEIHIRSVFLQGLLLMAASEIPDKFKAWSNLLSKWHEWLQSKQITPMAACIAFVRQYDGIRKIITGIDSQKQFAEIAAAFDSEPIDVPADLYSDDNMLINPANWSSI